MITGLPRTLVTLRLWLLPCPPSPVLDLVLIPLLKPFSPRSLAATINQRELEIQALSAVPLMTILPFLA
jgi:hypothetical protein